MISLSEIEEISDRSRTLDSLHGVETLKIIKKQTFINQPVNIVIFKNRISVGGGWVPVEKHIDNIIILSPWKITW